MTGFSEQGEVFVHPSAVVDLPVSIGARTRIWHFCHVMAGARIGADCSFGQNCFVAEGVIVGNAVRVQNNVSLYSGLEIEDEVFIGPSVVFTNVVNPRSAVPRKGDYQRTRVCHGATLGANATILPGITLGRYCFVAAGSVVTGDVLAHALVRGVPARQVGWMSAAGESLDFDDDGFAVCPATSLRYQRVCNHVRLVEGSS